ncbi:MAG: HlyD family secretion protein [Pseudomarimonas sp.]
MNRSSRDARWISSLAVFVLLAACADPPPQALGTLEWDRVTLPATASEPITAIAVVEGQQVTAGDDLVTLDPAHAEAREAAALAEVARLQQAVALLLAGARSESRDEAEARVAAALALAHNADQEHRRIRRMVEQNLLPAAQLDQAAAAARAAQSELKALRAGRALLANGSRAEDIAQAEAALHTAQAQSRSVAIDRARLQLRAPRAGRIDSLPYEVGEQPPIGAPLVVLLVGEVPYARLYVPQPLRADFEIGTVVQVRIAGSETTYAGRVRSVRSEPSFTPYYALTGKDAARLSYIAEVELGTDAAALPAGLPVSAELDQPIAP